jgi:hypothetical protein
MRRRRWVGLPCGWHKESSTECTKQGVTTELEQKLAKMRKMDDKEREMGMYGVCSEIFVMFHMKG